MTHIDAMKQAVEALLDTNASGVPAAHNDSAIEALNQAIAEAEKQEPVNWADYEPNGMHHNKPAQRTEPTQSLQCFHCQDTIETLNDKVMQLMAKRTWVGLTDEDIDEWTPEIHVVIKAIESKIKQKNGY